jgi:cardiolipin synthase A/B
MFAADQPKRLTIRELGEPNLRKLERRFLERGITVARTAGDLVRYHSKMIIGDRQELYLLAFNFTRLDIDH